MPAIPELLDSRTWKDLDHDKRAAYDDDRVAHHSRLLVVQTPAVRRTPLPVRPRPRHGESAGSCLRRLAAANHLRFICLRRYLATPRGSYGPIDPGQLAALAGRKPHAILRAFPELAPAVAKPAARHYNTEEIERKARKCHRANFVGKPGPRHLPPKRPAQLRDAMAGRESCHRTLTSPNGP